MVIKELKLFRGSQEVAKSYLSTKEAVNSFKITICLAFLIFFE